MRFYSSLIQHSIADKKKEKSPTKAICRLAFLKEQRPWVYGRCLQNQSDNLN